MRKFILSAVLAMVSANAAHCAEDAAITMRVLGDYEEIESVLASVQRALREGGSRSRNRSRTPPQTAAPTHKSERKIDDHATIFKLEDQLEGELDDET